MSWPYCYLCLGHVLLPMSWPRTLPNHPEGLSGQNRVESGAARLGLKSRRAVAQRWVTARRDLRPNHADLDFIAFRPC